MTLQQIFAANLYYLRKKNQLSQNQVAKKIYVSRSLIALIETNRHCPNLYVVEKVCKIFSVDYATITTINLAA